MGGLLATMASITFHNVTKTYSRADRQMLLRSFIGQMRRRPRRDRLVALRNLSFELGDGESIALVGRNGAGKSTILNLAAAISYPDAGAVRVDGRVAALLDLGSGFHPDLTGSENLLVNAALIGMSRKQVRARYAEMVGFAGLGAFIDQPLRTYSSGMIMRLAFSVAVGLDPDILLIDEVLSVGDATFRQKCFDRISALKHAGSLFVCASHSTSLLQQLCTKAIWIEQGVLKQSGEVDRVIDAYHEAESHTLEIRPAE